MTGYSQCGFSQPTLRLFNCARHSRAVRATIRDLRRKTVLGCLRRTLKGFSAALFIPHGLPHPALRSSEADFLSRFRAALQVADISYENSVFIIAKEKVRSVTTGECTDVVLSGSGRC